MIPLAVTALILAIALAWSLVVNGKNRRIAGRLLTFLGGKPDQTASWLEEITTRVVDQTRNLRRVRAVEYSLNRLLDELDHGLLTLDANLRLRYANRQAAVLFPNGDWTPGKALIQAVRDHRFERLARESMTQGKRRCGRFEMARQAEEPRTFHVQCGPLADGDGTWMMLRDISAQERAEQVRKDFVANASHELRTPLTLIRGYLEMIQDSGATDPESVLRATNIMGKHSVRLERIVEDMLTISRLENDGAQVNMESFSFEECVQGVISHVRHVFSGRDIRFVVEAPPDRLFFGDRFLWEQILSNLLENACKENPERALAVGVSWRVEEGRNVVRVRDNGIGIARADLPHIFRRFYRGAKTPARKGVKGTGLGLSIVRHAVEAQGGQIRADSTPGEETVFTIVVPGESPKSS